LVTLPTLIQPAILLTTLFAMKAWFPGFEDYFVSSSLWWHVAAFLVLDDMTQYW
jgi:hypothetical protein